MGRLDDTVLLVEVDRRDEDFVRSKFDRFVKVRAIAHALQLRIRDDPNLPVRARAIDPYDLALPVLYSDEADLRIGRLGAEFRNQSGEEALAPGCLGDVIDRINSAVQVCQDHPIGRR
jgi:hypothetical protein